MDASMHRVTSLIVSLTASLTVAPTLWAQSPPPAQPQSPPPAQPPPAATDEIVDLTQTTLSSPPAPAAAPATASEPPIRHGFYLRLVNGLGYVSAAGSGPRGHASVSGLGSANIIAIGGSVAHGVVVAGTAQATTTSATFDRGPFDGQTIAGTTPPVAVSTTADAGVSQLGVLVDWYPSPRLGWHVGLSGGIGAILVKNHADESSFVGAGGSGTLFGGYDFSIAKDWSIGLSLLATGTTRATLKEAKEQTHTGYRLGSLAIGLGASILYF
jgi:hypothetical protein